MAYVSIDWCVACGERDPMTGIEGWQLSTHFLDRALDMALDPGEIRDALLRPGVIRPHPTEADQSIHVSGRISIVVNPAACRAITVMWLAQFRTGDTRRREVATGDEQFFRDPKGSPPA